MEKKKEQLTYTLILHQIRKKLKLTLMEYCVADCIYHLSNNPDSKITGWCYASKQTIGGMLGTTQQTIFDILKKLIGKGFIEKHQDTKHLRTTQRWYNNVVLIKAQQEYQEALHPIKKGDSGLSRNFIKKLDTIKIRDIKIKDKDIDVAKAPSFFVQVQKYFTSAYKQRFGREPAINFGMDGKVVNRVKGLFPDIKETYKLIDAFLISQKGKEHGYTLSVCFSAHTINLWQAGELTVPVSGVIL